MKFVRNVLQDLVEKKLWPLAVALLVGLAAVPVLLGGGKSDTGTDPSAVAAAPAENGLANHRDAARAAVVSLEQQAAGPVRRAGRVRNPFVQHHMPKAQDPAQAADTAVKAAKSLLDGLASAGGSGGTTPPVGGSTPVVSTPPVTGDQGSGKDTKKTAITYGVALKFGEAGAQKTYRNVARLTPLPSSDNPFFVYLGLSDDGRSAVFLVDANAVPSGDGTCLPSNEQCEQVELKKGDIEFFQLQSGTAGVVEYQLEITDIAKKPASKASAAKAHARESRAGRDYLREVVAENPDALAGWDFSSSLGLLVKKDATPGADVANLPDGVALAAQGEGATTATPAFMAVP
jgi:hypothetical protein